MEKKYLKLVALFTFIIIGVIGTFNWFVNPYSIYNSPEFDGFNADKPEFINFLRLTKAQQVTVYEPTSLILGTSRSGIGLDPDYSGWKDERAYNLALPGVHIYELLRYFQHANASKKIKKVVLAVDFRFFINDSVGSGFSDLRMLANEDGSKNFTSSFGKIADMVSTLFSMDSLMTSLKTVRHQGWSKETLSSNGSWDRSSELFDHRKAFNAYMKSTFNRLDDVNNGDINDFKGEKYFSSLLRTAYNENIELYLVISPSHAWHWEAYRIKDLWNKLEDMKRMVVRINEKEASRAEKSPFPVWDFSGYSTVTTEPVPLLGQNKIKMEWFWESIHYKKSLGNLVLDKLFSNQVANNYLTDDFGVKLNSQNMDEHLSQQRILQKNYMANNKSDIAHIMDLLKK